MIAALNLVFYLNSNMHTIRFWMIADFTSYDSLDHAFSHISSHLQKGVYAVTLRHLGKLSYREETTLYNQLKEHFPKKKIFLHHPQNLQYPSHLPFSRIGEIPNALAQDKSLSFAVSTHSADEAGEAFKAGADMVTLSPIYSPFSKPHDTRSTIEPVFKKNVYLLGGINHQRAQILIQKGCSYIAGISLFY